MKCLQIKNIVKEIKFEGVWGELEEKNLFPETIIRKISQIDASFHMKWRTTGKV